MGGRVRLLRLRPELRHGPGVHAGAGGDSGGRAEGCLPFHRRVVWKAAVRVRVVVWVQTKEQREEERLRAVVSSVRRRRVADVGDDDLTPHLKGSTFLGGGAEVLQEAPRMGRAHSETKLGSRITAIIGLPSASGDAPDKVMYPLSVLS